MTLGGYISSCRRKKHMTVFTAARKLHMDPQVLINFEHNEGLMTKSLLLRLINMYGMSKAICGSLMLREIAEKHPERVRIIKNEDINV